MNKRYQVFVSSTYLDLVAERQKVMHALLELNCIPVGMELFPAADDDQWTHITACIDDSDYYVVIVAGRYGSVGPSGKSYTQMEYEYALNSGIPTIAFIHAAPNRLADANRETQRGDELNLFRELLQRKLCKMWTSADELSGVVSRSLIQAIGHKDRPGWVRGTDLISLQDENAALRAQVSEMEQRLALAERGYVELDEIIQRFSTDAYSVQRGALHTKFSWGSIFHILAAAMWDGVTTDVVAVLLNNSMYADVGAHGIGGLPVQIPRQDVQHLTGQLRALGLIELIDTSKPYDLRRWQLTAFGRAVYNQEALHRT
jgi:hypothetical protein